MEATSLTKFWPLIHSVIREFSALAEPYIEETAIRENIPIELYYYSEFGLDSFSTREFQRRDPFSNPLLFEKSFATLNFKGWIEPLPDDRYKVTDSAREGVRQIIQAGDQHLLSFESFTDIDLNRLCVLLKQMVKANEFATEPPEKWAITKRFRFADNDSSLIIQVRDYLMDLFAYHDDSHISAAHPHFGQAGIIWNVLGALLRGNALSAEKITENLSFRGYETYEYEVALQAAVEIGWAEKIDSSDTFSITQEGRELHVAVEKLTDKYFYGTWSIMTQEELDELYGLLLDLREQLSSYR